MVGERSKNRKIIEYLRRFASSSKIRVKTPGEGTTTKFPPPHKIIPHGTNTFLVIFQGGKGEYEYFFSQVPALVPPIAVSLLTFSVQ